MAAMIRRTCGSWIPRARSCCSTMRRRATERSLSFCVIDRDPAGLEIHDLAVVGQLEAERRHRNVAALDRSKVAGFVVLPRGLLASNPIIELPPWVRLLDDHVPVDPLPQARHP